MNYNVEIRPNHYYTVAETCKMLGIHRNTLFTYTANGHIICHKSVLNGRKYYTGREISSFIRRVR
jgi:excisionase family DNA binding protein